MAVVTGDHQIADRPDGRRQLAGRTSRRRGRRRRRSCCRGRRSASTMAGWLRCASSRTSHRARRRRTGRATTAGCPGEMARFSSASWNWHSSISAARRPAQIGSPTPRMGFRPAVRIDLESIRAMQVDELPPGRDDPGRIPAQHRPCRRSSPGRHRRPAPARSASIRGPITATMTGCPRSTPSRTNGTTASRKPCIPRYINASCRYAAVGLGRLNAHRRCHSCTPFAIPARRCARFLGSPVATAELTRGCRTPQSPHAQYCTHSTLTATLCPLSYYAEPRSRTFVEPHVPHWSATLHPQRGDARAGWPDQFGGSTDRATAKLGARPSTTKEPAMGLFHRSHEHDAPAVQRYQMREKLLAIGDDYWIENESGDKVFKVNGKAVRFRQTLHPGGPDGQRTGQDPGTQAAASATRCTSSAAAPSATVHKAHARHPRPLHDRPRQRRGPARARQFRRPRVRDRARRRHHRHRSRRSGSGCATPTGSRSAPARTRHSCWPSPSASTRWPAADPTAQSQRRAQPRNQARRPQNPTTGDRQNSTEAKVPTWRKPIRS